MLEEEPLPGYNEKIRNTILACLLCVTIEKIIVSGKRVTSFVFFMFDKFHSERLVMACESIDVCDKEMLY